MYYYKKEQNKIVKYKVDLEAEKLKELRSEIIERCSLITHKCYKTTERPDYFDFEHIRNYKDKIIGIIEYNDFYSSPEDEYLVEYDYYNHPELVTLIEDLLKGNTNSIDKIKNSIENKDDEDTIILDEQNKIIQKLSNKKNKDISKQIELLEKCQEKLLEYKKKKKLNKNQISANTYIEKVLACIKLTEIISIDIKNVLEVKNFFKESSEATIETNLNKILKFKK